MVQDQFGMMGLLTFIRGAETDPGLVALALGRYVGRRVQGGAQRQTLAREHLVHCVCGEGAQQQTLAREDVVHRGMDVWAQRQTLARDEDMCREGWGGIYP